jgi:hypothetical protein
MLVFIKWNFNNQEPKTKWSVGSDHHPTIWKTYVIHVYPYEKHVFASYVKHMGYFSWRHHMFLPLSICKTCVPKYRAVFSMQHSNNASGVRIGPTSGVSWYQTVWQSEILKSQFQGNFEFKPTKGLEYSEAIRRD